MKSVDALLFDLDGTLIDSRRDLTQCVQKLQADYHVPPSSESSVAAFIGDGVGKLVQRALPLLDDRALMEAVERFKDLYRQHCLDTTDVYPGIRQVLDHFKTKPMAVVTNKPARISGRILDGLRLSNYFRCIIGGDSTAKKKPDPEPVLAALSQLKMSAAQVVMIGDSPHDIVAGRAAGAATCGILSNIVKPEVLRESQPDYLISSPLEILTLFR